ncbi:hypothetical protein FAGAP_864 [Fusarium agapanthi]|uniref:Uncharacterized protein n=1 Tax=Fusarium agapanthi TaxID=1803897 RepID=A0A9P5BQ87_9HYPO|nr:hypothetical protein FAGAP_864 [Fusarium agapanthi]
MPCDTHADGKNTNLPCQPEQPAGPMQAISAILNPDTVGRGKDGNSDGQEKVLIFQSLPNRTVGLDQVNFSDKSVNGQKDEGDGVVGYYKNPASFVPTLRPHSKLVSTIFNEIVHVYGVNEQTGLISLMSPVFSPVKNAYALYNNFAACSKASDDGKGYLYFQMKDKKNRIYIWEKDLSDPDSEPTIVVKTEEADEGTDIIAFHDGKNRWIVYQTTDARDECSIMLRCVDTKEGEEIPSMGGNIANGKIARIAAVHVSSEEENVNKVFVYLTGKGNQLWRSEATITGGEPKFTPARELTKKTWVNDYTGLSVVADPATRTNLIFTITEKGKSISLNRDAWK